MDTCFSQTGHVGIREVSKKGNEPEALTQLKQKRRTEAFGCIALIM